MYYILLFCKMVMNMHINTVYTIECLRFVQVNDMISYCHIPYIHCVSEEF